ncbi:LuxR family transcriptional regulator [Tenacibaculum sp. 190524A02b]|uniref:helix-turn-helix transcriptional regulator n=1 Tax=Tenacibaculum vairaonense TaxID=3137860 RepID=UPI0032B2B2B0
MSNVNDFFSEKNTVYDTSDIKKFNLEKFIKSIEAFARVTYKSVYVINYHSKGFDYVSENPLFLCGNSATEVKQMGYAFYFKHVPEEDLELLLKVNTAGFDFYEQIPREERLDYTISYDFNLIGKDGNQFLVNHKLTPVVLNTKGKIGKALCLVSLSNKETKGNVTIVNEKTGVIHTYNLEKNYWETKTKIKLKPREIEILQLSARGYTLEEIGEKIFVSSNTVKFHRKKIFEKMEVHSISEAIAYATANKLL